MNKDKIQIKYQIYDLDSGDYILEPYHVKESAEFMAGYLTGNNGVLEIEVEV